MAQQPNARRPWQLIYLNPWGKFHRAGSLGELSAGVPRWGDGAASAVSLPRQGLGSGQAEHSESERGLVGKQCAMTSGAFQNFLLL